MNTPQYKDKTWLTEKYWTDSLSPSDMGNLCGVTRHAVVGQMRRRGVGFRNASEARLLNLSEKPYRDEQWLYRKYKKQKVSIHGLCKLCNCCPKILKYWLGKHGIEIRTRSEANRLRRAKNLKRLYGSWSNRVFLLIKDTVISFIKGCGKYF